MSPIIVDLDDDGFHLTGLDQPVAFDMTGDGIADRLAWTSPAQRDAFLCRDLNGNGKIDSGRELFGNYSLLSGGGRAPNGYEALKELDDVTHGGNGNGSLILRTRHGTISVCG